MKPAPVLLIAFNRPEQTASCLKAIQAGGDRQLFVSLDAPRVGNATDTIQCKEVRETIERLACSRDVQVRVRERNAGCAVHIPEAISWVMDRMGEAIILEDDCIPSASFFRFADELLERYREDPTVAQISGSNFQLGNRRGDTSYYFSGLSAIWGWATWQRAWKSFSADMEQWSELRGTDWIETHFPEPSHAHYWRMMFDDAAQRRRGSLDSWAIPWTYCVWKEQMLTATPSVNLVDNIGEVGGANTSSANHRNMTIMGEMEFPLRHPPSIHRDDEADRFVMDQFYFGSNGLERAYWKLRIPIPIATVRTILASLRRLRGAR